ncbi:hypothetical protein CD178_02444 [Komagataeibacter saccharivorans]|uniref:Uncharacterized protein n=1 Tax=Komagataeibacter saccharivorans TaxID=265959 RepID=A0A347WE98_9PROT|nr:hypothetical protein CD178_02444 [Komagataeibacter saccharivorans]
MDTAMSFQQAEDGHFSGSAPASFFFAMSIEMALIDFDFTRNRCLMSNLSCDISSLYWLILCQTQVLFPGR